MQFLLRAKTDYTRAGAGAFDVPAVLGYFAIVIRRAQDQT
jgi:hypothetical protein